MDYMATITSKRQFTIPARLFKKAGYKPQQKMLVRLLDPKNGVITISPMIKLVEKLAGSVTISDEYKGLDLDQIIEKSKYDHFSKSK